MNIQPNDAQLPNPSGIAPLKPAPIFGLKQPDPADPTIPPRPSILPVNPDLIPLELKNLRNWVAWVYELRETKSKSAGANPNAPALAFKFDKVPMQPHGAYAKVNVPYNHCDFDPALKAYLMHSFAGIGFVVKEGEGIVAIDLDKVRNPVTGEIIQVALDIIKAIDSYTEISPSGTGIRIFLKGELPPGGRATTQPHGFKFEIYASGKYLTVTGQHLPGTPTCLMERLEECKSFHAMYIARARRPASSGASSSTRTYSSPRRAARRQGPAPPDPGGGDSPDGDYLDSDPLSDDEVLAKARASKNEALFNELWQGDLSGSDNDASKADLRLALMLAFWTAKNAEQMDRIFRTSGLMRAKWEQTHSSDGRTYGQMTIDKAIELCSDVYSPPTVQFPELEADDIPGVFKEGSGYGQLQLTQLLYPAWECVSLQTNLAHAFRMRDIFGAWARCCPELGWLHYNGRVWERDDRKSSRTGALVASLSRQVHEEAAQLYKYAHLLATAGRTADAEAMSKAAQEHNRFARIVESKNFVVDTLHLAAGFEEFRIDVKAFEPQPWVIGFENGVWDHGQWRQHRIEDFFLELCPVAIEPAVDGREWREVLDRITGHDPDLEKTLQECAGYILSGSSHLRVILWVYGEKGTGKSTYAQLLKSVLGKYSTMVTPAKLTMNADRERLGAQLWNHVLAICPEAGHKRIEPELLKTLSGGDTLTARFLYQEPFDVTPRHVLLLVSNDPPRLDAYDEALKDRMIVLPFLHALNSQGPLSLAGGKRIEGVRDDVHSDLVKGFAVWALEGAARVMTTLDIYRAPLVQAAMTQFWRDTDPLTEFWETIAIDELYAGIFAKDLRSRYEWWCEGVGARPFSPAPWKRACESIGLLQVRRTKQNIRTWYLPKMAAAPFAGTHPGATPAAANVAVNHQAGIKLNIFGTEVVTGDGLGSILPASTEEENQSFLNQRLLPGTNGSATGIVVPFHKLTSAGGTTTP